MKSVVANVLGKFGFKVEINKKADSKKEGKIEMYVLECKERFRIQFITFMLFVRTGIIKLR